jgi:hypothetical protein
MVLFFLYLKPSVVFFNYNFFVQTCASDHSHRALLSRPLTLLTHLHFLCTTRPKQATSGVPRCNTSAAACTVAAAAVLAAGIGATVTVRFARIPSDEPHTVDLRQTFFSNCSQEQFASTLI